MTTLRVKIKEGTVVSTGVSKAGVYTKWPFVDFIQGDGSVITKQVNIDTEFEMYKYYSMFRLEAEGIPALFVRNLRNLVFTS